METGTRVVKGARACSTQSFCGLELERSVVADRACGAVAVLRSGHATLVGGGRRTIRAADIDCGAAGPQGVGLGGAAVYIRPGLVDRPLFFALQSMMLGGQSGTLTGISVGLARRYGSACAVRQSTGC